MSQRVLATYRNGTFELETPCDLPEETQVELTVHTPFESHSIVTDPKERRLVKARLIERMKNNPIPVDAPKFDRESLYDCG